MPCPVCACDATRPLAMREVNGFAGASHICDSCLSVWFVLSDAVISRVALAGAARGWQSVRDGRAAENPPNIVFYQNRQPCGERKNQPSQPEA